MSVEAALRAIRRDWWQILEGLDSSTAGRFATLLAELPDDPAEATLVGADALALLLPSLAPDHPVVLAARGDEIRRGSPRTKWPDVLELRALAGVSAPATLRELERLDPRDVATAAGLPSWRACIPMDVEPATRLTAMAAALRRIRAATGVDDLTTWFHTPIKRLRDRSPRDVVAEGDVEALTDLATALETFTPS